MTTRARIFAVAALATLVADQATKAWARGAFLPGRTVSLIPNYWEWELSFNYGSAFGLFNTQAWARAFLTTMALAVAALIAAYVLRRDAIVLGKRIRWGPLHDDQKWLTVALGLVWGGAVGNAVDRIADGKVTDFILWRLADVYRHPQFNVADAALVAGVIILALDVGGDQKRYKPRKAKT